MPDVDRSIRDESGTTLADIGERGILEAIFPLLPAGSATLLGPGDDAAVVAAADGRVVATTDLMVQDRDFRFDWSSPQDVGVKAAAQNLADVAAMGAVPTALLVGLVAPPTLPLAWARGLAEGLALGCEGTGAGVVGGDLSSGDVVMVSITALGDLQGREPVLRSGARAGDVLAVAGTLGWSAAGLALLKAGPDASPARWPELLAAHRRPQPPYPCGPAAAMAGATAMLDISDGLLRDSGRMARASGVCLDLDDVALGAFVDVLREAAVAVGEDPWAWVLSGGEDHGLLATFPDGVAPAGFTVIGSVRPAPPGRETVTVKGHEQDSIGWDHFTRPSA